MALKQQDGHAEALASTVRALQMHATELVSRCNTELKEVCARTDLPQDQLVVEISRAVEASRVFKDEVKELICSYDPESRGGGSPDGRKVKGTIQWVDAETAVRTEARLYDRLFSKADPEDAEEGTDFIDHLNPDSLEKLSGALVESSVATLGVGEPFQLERIGYFCIDPDSPKEGELILNRSVALRDSWAKASK